MRSLSWLWYSTMKVGYLLKTGYCPRVRGSKSLSIEFGCRSVGEVCISRYASFSMALMSRLFRWWKKYYREGIFEGKQIILSLYDQTYFSIRHIWVPWQCLSDGLASIHHVYQPEHICSLHLWLCTRTMRLAVLTSNGQKYKKDHDSYLYRWQCPTVWETTSWVNFVNILTKFEASVW